MDDLIFERDVARVAARLAYPPTPDVRGRVLELVARPERRRRWHLRPALALAAAAALAIAMAVPLAVPASRSAVAQFFGVSRSKVEILPTPAPGVTPTPLPTPAGITFSATPTTLDGARTASGFAPALPPQAGAPVAVYLVDYGRPPAVVLQYPQFDLWESHTDGFFVKGVPPGIEVRDVTVAGRAATWVGAGEHIVRFVDPGGETVAASVRTVGRATLIWSTPAGFYRLETELPEAESIALAETLP
jgi:hypothetical protein